jgi:hypothetical protein
VKRPKKRNYFAGLDKKKIHDEKEITKKREIIALRNINSGSWQLLDLE